MKWLIPIIFIVSCAHDSGWKKSELERMTYPSSQWSADDLGSYPSAEKKDLLKTFAPNFYRHSADCGAMDFYQQYGKIAKLVNKKSVLPLTQLNLKRRERSLETKVILTQEPKCLSHKRPPLYASEWKEQIPLGGRKYLKLNVLRYSFSFFKTNLPKVQSPFLKARTLFAEKEKWHFLNLHSAVYFLMDQDQKPIVVVLAQHNYFRTYLIGRDVTLEQAREICLAERSYAPYFCHLKGKQSASMSNKDFDWVVTQEAPPLLALWDLIPPKSKRKKLNYRIEFLASRDPLLTSWISLAPAEQNWFAVPYFQHPAPAGMKLYTHPDLAPVWKTAAYYYFDPYNEKILEQQRDFDQPLQRKSIYKFNSIRFFKALKKMTRF